MTRFLPRAATRTSALVATAFLLGACEVRTGDDAASAPPAGESAPTTGTAAGDVAPSPAVDPTSLPPAERPRADMRLEVDVKARQVHVYRGGARTASYPVAVGSAEWPTRTGEWTVSQVVFNPEWVPPDESWAEEREGKAPGDPENPLGQAQLIYDPPRTIHGTNDPSSVGKAVSHGSIRMTNETITALAREVLEVAGVEKDEAWFRRVRENRSEKQIIDLPRVVPITVR